ncbi:hypothetical protein [Microcella sp.]|uniref:hypothetical protein n=1 Tax=Microcella sp. TaxID=1913979 RepID=UPI00391B564C
MTISKRLDISPELRATIVQGGETGHRIAVANYGEPGSNSYLFGAERYHRSCEIIKAGLHEFGLTDWMTGAGHRAGTSAYELWFATAKSSDIHNRSAFDFASDARLEAGAANMAAYLPGMDPDTLPGKEIIHVILCGNSDNGLTAVFLGKLVSVDSRRVQWGEVEQIDSVADRRTYASAPESSSQVTYADQPEPVLGLAALETSLDATNGK